MGRSDYNRRSECDEDCQCEDCCGGIKKVTVPKALLGYTTRCIGFCRTGGHNLENIQIDESWSDLEGTLIAVRENYDVKCSNSKLWGNHNFELTFDLSCGDSVITRDMVSFDRTVSIPANYTWSSVPLECPTHRGNVEWDINLDIEASGIETTTILADLIDIIDLEFIDGSIPLGVVTPELPVPTTMLVEVSVTVDMFQSS